MSHFIESLEGRQFFAAGTLDPAFGTAGSAYLLAVPGKPTKTPNVIPTLTRVDAAGRTIVVTKSNDQYSVSRLTADGAPDRTFAAATGGYLNVVDAAIVDIEIDANNRVYVLSDRLNRYTSSGKLDKSFGTQGNVFGLFNGLDMTFDSVGSIWIVGTDAYTSELGNDEMAVARLDPDGNAVSTFGNGGVFELPHVPSFVSPGDTTHYNAEGSHIRLLADGSIVVLGTTDSEDSLSSNQVQGPDREAGIIAAKFLSTGKFDKSYGKTGLRAFKELDVTPLDDDPMFRPVGIRADGAVVFYRKDDDGTTQNRFLTPAGGGGVPINFGRTLVDAQFIRQPDGQDLVLDRTNRLLTRNNADGTIDPTFNGGQAFTGVTAATVGTDGSVILAGPGANKTDARFFARRVFGSEAPAGRLVPSTLVAANKTLPFRVVWRDDDAVDASTVTGLELRLIGPDGMYYRPRLTGKTESDGTVIADYVLKTIDGQPLTADDNGLYAVRLLAGRVKDVNGVAASAQTLGSLVIRIG